jgi:hypothetical protein
MTRGVSSRSLTVIINVGRRFKDRSWIGIKRSASSNLLSVPIMT